MNIIRKTVNIETLKSGDTVEIDNDLITVSDSYRGVKIYHCRSTDKYWTNLFNFDIFNANTLQGIKCKISRFLNT